MNIPILQIFLARGRVESGYDEAGESNLKAGDCADRAPLECMGFAADVEIFVPASPAQPRAADA